uniref:Uncharacterized protein n=1 Tax=Haptolina ericina TaxID=156174 RepID=A0A7S3EZ90_9EUKA
MLLGVVPLRAECKWAVRRCLLSSAGVLSGERIKETLHAIHAHEHTSEYLLPHVCFAVRCDPRETGALDGKVMRAIERARSICASGLVCRCLPLCPFLSFAIPPTRTHPAHCCLPTGPQRSLKDNNLTEQAKDMLRASNAERDSPIKIEF